jgi:precorrin-4 methylase
MEHSPITAVMAIVVAAGLIGVMLTLSAVAPKIIASRASIRSGALVGTPDVRALLQ